MSPAIFVLLAGTFHKLTGLGCVEALWWGVPAGCGTPQGFAHFRRGFFFFIHNRFRIKHTVGTLAGARATPVILRTVAVRGIRD